MVNFPTLVGRARRLESRFDNDFAAGRGWGRLGRFTGVEGVCDQLSGWLYSLGLTLPLLAFRWAQRQTSC